MKKSVLLTLVLALAIAVGISTTASSNAGAGTEAQATAKKKGKKKCAKPKKGKKKAGKSLAAESAAKKKAGKKKAKKKCAKPKKGKKKAGGFKLAAGVYNDAKGGELELVVLQGGNNARITIPFGCINYPSDTVPLKSSGAGVEAGESRNFTVAGIASSVSWSITVKPGLSYVLKYSWTIPDFCSSTGERVTGKLVKKP